MIIRNLNVVGVSFAPSKANSPLVIDANAMLALTVAGEFFKTIPWRNTQVIQLFGGVQDGKFLPRGAVQIWGKAPQEMTLKELFAILVAERLDHGK
jgi:hypothetical protein